VAILISLSLALPMASGLAIPRMADLIEYLILRLTPLLSHDVTFDETAPYPHDVFECAGDKDMDESIYVDEGLQGVDGDEDDPLLSCTLSPEPIPASTLAAEAPQATTSSTVAVEASRVEGEIVSEPGAPSHIQKAHPPQQIIGNLNERVTQSSMLAHLSCFTNTLFIALFEPRDVGHTLFYLSWINAMHEELENF
jgi:hypothetical protein